MDTDRCSSEENQPRSNVAPQECCLPKLHTQPFNPSVRNTCKSVQSLLDFLCAAMAILLERNRNVSSRFPTICDHRHHRQNDCAITTEKSKQHLSSSVTDFDRTQLRELEVDVISQAARGSAHVQCCPQLVSDKCFQGTVFVRAEPSDRTVSKRGRSSSLDATENSKTCESEGRGSQNEDLHDMNLEAGLQTFQVEVVCSN